MELRVRLLAAAALAWLALAAGAVHAQSSRSWNRVDGQPLADAVAQWGASNTDLTYTLPGGTIFDLQNATFSRPNSSQVVGGRAFSRGTFTIRGSGNGSAAVIDTAQRAGLVPLALVALEDVRAGRQPRSCARRLCQPVLRRCTHQPPGAGARTWPAQVTLVNLCVTHVELGGVPLANPLLMGIFSLSPVTRSLTARRATLYIPQRSVALNAYRALVNTLPWPSGEEPPRSGSRRRSLVGASARAHQVGCALRARVRVGGGRSGGHGAPLVGGHAVRADAGHHAAL